MPEHDLSIYGKVPPQAKDLEEAVLGAIMLEKEAIETAARILKPEAFYVDAHQRIYRACLSLTQRSQNTDLLTVIEELKKAGELELVGGPFYITQLTNRVVSSANTEQHCQIIFEKYLKREQIRIGSEMVQQGYDETLDAFEALDTANANLGTLSLENVKGQVNRIDVVLVSAVKRIEHLRHQQEDITGVPSGLPDIDRVTFGWQPTDLIILAARPSVGKTAFALNLARNAALHPTKPTPVAVFSLEMGEGQLVNRILAAESEIWLDKIQRGKLEEHEMKQLYINGIQRLAAAPIFIDDTAGINIYQLRAKCRRLKKQHNIGIVIIDYLQLMSGTDNRKNREQEISEISRGLKGLAKELNVPVIALSQLSREVEKRASQVPNLSDLRESGAIEQDADVVCFLYRPDYGMLEQDIDPMIKGVTQVKIAKHRNGSLEEIPLRAELNIQKFFTLEQHEAFQSKFKISPISGLYQRAAANSAGTPAKLYIQPNPKNFEDEDDPF